MRTLFRLFATLAVALLPTVVLAASTSDNGGLLFGQEQRYSVTVRGNGSAILFGSLTVPQDETGTVAEMKLDFSNITVQDFAAYQQIVDTCVATACTGVPESYIYPGYRQTSNRYKKIEFTKSGDIFTLPLPEVVKSPNSSKIIFSYSTPDYTKKAFLGYNYTFTTPKLEVRSSSVSVSIKTDSDWYLSGAGSTIAYDSGYGASTMPTTAALDQQSDQLDRIASNIGYTGSLYKSTSDLATGETYSVSGHYAHSRLALYALPLLWTLGIIILLIIAAFFLARWMIRKSAGQKPILSAMKGMKERERKILVVLIGSFVAAAATLGAVYLTYLLTWGAYTYYSIGLITGMLLTLITVIVYAALIIGPALMVGLTFKSWRSGFGMFFAQLAWLIVGLIVYLLVVNGTGQMFPNPAIPVDGYKGAEAKPTSESYSNIAPETVPAGSADAVHMQ